MEVRWFTTMSGDCERMLMWWFKLLIKIPWKFLLWHRALIVEKMNCWLVSTYFTVTYLNTPANLGNRILKLQFTYGDGIDYLLYFVHVLIIQ